MKKLNKKQRVIAVLIGAPLFYLAWFLPILGFLQFGIPSSDTVVPVGHLIYIGLVIISMLWALKKEDWKNKVPVPVLVFILIVLFISGYLIINAYTSLPVETPRYYR